jgi:hypothetical protein
MSVYVDPIFSTAKTKKWPYTKACHLFADTLNELHQIALEIGLKKAWFQDHNIPHYDLTPNKRKLAIAYGVIEVDLQQSIKIWKKLRKEMKK